ncbi:Ribosomal protein S24/S35 [Quillaja saponaria]|uniref:Ribosomal protein S24/S35 n=1 Tax=Quillaja saponaria TaxID=32244 RepID=A0AAD7M5H1_QUISA|nr:Ribosomal protein S24/S35 [Quillaja saponaria]
MALKRALFRNVSVYAGGLLLSSLRYKSNPNPNPTLVSLSASTQTKLRFYSSRNNSLGGTNNLSKTLNEDVPVDDEIVSNQDMKMMINKYFEDGDERELPSIIEAILQRKLSGKHEETDDELLDELEMKPIDDISDEDIESDFEDAHDTDEEIDNLYSARDIVTKRLMKDEYFNMDDKKWDGMIEEAIKHGYLQDTKQCEEILEDMLDWDKLLPDEIKRKVEAKFNELGDMCERGELEPDKAYKLFKEFEDEMVAEYLKTVEAEGPPQFDETAGPDKKKDVDDPPGEGPILRWQTRVVFAPGGNAWHPKNRKVKLSVTVKELGLSKYQFRRLRELVGKRYHPGKDELTITSERFEHREENRKDCLRTLLSLIEEAGKANKLVDDARTAYVKERLRANPSFMEKLHTKTMRLRESSSVV